MTPLAAEEFMSPGNVKTCKVTILDDATNATVAKLPWRKYPKQRRKRMRLFWIETVLAMAVLIGTPGCAHRGSLEDNKAIARMVFEDVLSQGKWDVSERIHAPDFVARAGKRTEGRAEELESAKGWRSAMPDLVMRIQQMVAEGDLVAVRWTGHGTNTGTGNGLPATGKRLEIEGITIFRIVEGRIVEEWNSIDELGLMQQLGVVPKG